MSKGKILVVDDDLVFLKIIERQLKNLGFEVYTTHDNDLHISELLERHDFVLALVDYYLEEDKGIDLVKRLPAFKGLPVVYISSSDEQSVLDDILSEVPEGFIDKNRINPRELRATLDLIIYKKEKEEELKELNATLDRKVKDRTEKLDAAIAALEIEVSAKEDALNKLEEALKSEVKFGTLKSNMISNLSHEFKTPLSSIKSSAQILKKMLEMTSEGEEKLFKHVSRIMEGSNQLNSILNRILMVEKSGLFEVEKELSKVDIHLVLQEICDRINNSLSIETVLQIHEDYQLQQGLLDPKLVELVLTNLLSNAAKFSPENSAIKLFLRTSLAKRSLEIIVEDHGIGMSNKDIEQIFHRFFRGENVGSIEGTGIGMSIVKRAVDALGGEINISSTLNKGTNIQVILPI
jgi:signal transduction histidine kinase